MTLQPILDFITNAILVGTLSGMHNPQQLAAFRNMFSSVETAFANNNYSTARTRLIVIVGLCNGQTSPPDLVKGSAKPQLATMIQTLIDELSVNDNTGKNWFAMKRQERVT